MTLTLTFELWPLGFATGPRVERAVLIFRSSFGFLELQRIRGFFTRMRYINLHLTLTFSFSSY